MAVLAIIRHGQSEWNLENRFTGWVDVNLTTQGVEEATAAATLLSPYHFDLAFTSDLKRAQNTLHIILEKNGQENLEVVRDKALNERHYGDLQGLNKAETAAKFGDAQVHTWRRSFDIAPPNGESLKDTAARVIPYYETYIEPLLREGKNIIISAHGNSLRALIMHIEQLSPEQILARELGTASPIVYEFDGNMQVLSVKDLKK